MNEQLCVSAEGQIFLSVFTKTEQCVYSIVLTPKEELNKQEFHQPDWTQLLL